MEQQLSSKSWTLYESLLDLNVPATQLQTDWAALMNLRGRVLNMYGVATPGVPALSAPTGAAAATPGPVSEVTWKNRLNEALTKVHSRSLQKGDIMFTSVEAGPKMGYISTVSAPNFFAQDYSLDSPLPNKKLAEQEAARLAVEAEFPDLYMQALAAEGGKIAPSGQKRKAADAGLSAQPGVPVPESAKSRLSTAACLLLGRSTTKQDVIYDVQEADGAQYTCTVTLPTWDPVQAWQSNGEFATRKEAEAGAAEVALAALESMIAPLEQERKMKKDAAKKQKSQEWQQKKAEQDKMKKAGLMANQIPVGQFSNAMPGMMTGVPNMM